MRQARGGELYSSKFFERQRGEGARAEQIGQTFRVFKKRFGLDKPSWSLSSRSFRRPLPKRERGQELLF